WTALVVIVVFSVTFLVFVVFVVFVLFIVVLFLVILFAATFLVILALALFVVILFSFVFLSTSLVLTRVISSTFVFLVLSSFTGSADGVYRECVRIAVVGPIVYNDRNFKAAFQRVAKGNGIVGYLKSFGVFCYPERKPVRVGVVCIDDFKIAERYREGVAGADLQRLLADNYRSGISLSADPMGCQQKNNKTDTGR